MTHRCTKCGEEKPLEAFRRHRENRPRSAWYCDPCETKQGQEWRERTGYKSTDAVRQYRSDPEKRERDRERSRRWKREHLGQPGKPNSRRATNAWPTGGAS
jgi:hypothetical protein